MKRFMLRILLICLASVLVLCCGCEQSVPPETTATTEATQPTTTVPVTTQAPKEMAKVTFLPNNGDTAIVVETEKGELMETVPQVQKRGCEFVGWFANEKAWNPEEDVVERNLTVTAMWKLADSAFENDPNAAVRAEGTQLRAMSFNTRLPTVGNVPVEGRDVRFLRVAQAYEPDVIALQEFGETWSNAFQTVFTDTTYRLISGEETAVNGKQVNSTIAYRTDKLTLVEYDTVAYQFSGDPVNRIFTWAIFETKEGQQFAVTTTHWSTSSEDARVQEAKELAGWIRETVDTKGIPVIALGDYNSRDGSAPYSTLQKQAVLESAKYAAASRGLVALTHHAGFKTSAFKNDMVNTVSSIDHVFFTQGVQALYYDTVITEDALCASDHAPIYADLKFVK